MSALIEKATISGNMNKDYAGEHFLRSKKLDKIEYHQDLKISKEENDYGEDDEDNPHLIWAMTVIYSLIALIGIIGNILVIVVVKKVPSMITPTNCYLVSLALSDCLFLCAAWPVEFSYLHADQNDYAFGAIGCKILTFLPYLGINASSMSIMAFTIERFIGICYPLRARYICTVKRAKLIILFIWCFCILYNSPWLYLATLKQIDGVVVFVADFTTFYILPMFLYIYLYGKIAYTLTKCEWVIGTGSATRHVNNIKNDGNHNKNFSKSAAKSSITSQSSVKGPNRSPIKSNEPESQTNNIGASNSRRASTSVNSKLQVIKMLALVAFIFAVCWLPYRAMVMYNSFASAINWEPWDYDWLIFMSKTMIFFNCAINPVLYNLMSSRFRKAFRQLLRGQKGHINVYKRGSSYLHDQNKKINGDEATEMTADIKRFSTIVTSGREEECLNGNLNN
uniref:Thyrotropin-releasing hormone receptor n=2 Tax=Meloidogyne TaxID=189290 RepID=A0A914LV29_MELIC